MICTCTMNPSLDYLMHFEKAVVPGELNRCEKQEYRPAGKGINVSIVLNNFEIPSRALGFLGGFTRDYFIQLLEQYSFITPNFIYTEEPTRINVKLIGNGEQTQLNTEGASVSVEEMQKLADKVQRLNEGDFFVLAGTCQAVLAPQVLEMLTAASKEKVRLCLDTDASVMGPAMALHPFMVKRRERDLEGLSEKPSEEEIAAAVAAIHARGAAYVLVLSDDSRRAWMADDTGLYRCEVLGRNEKPLLTIGAGDSMIAGFITNYLRSLDGVESFRYAACCARATVSTQKLCGRQDVEPYYQEMKVEKL